MPATTIGATETHISWLVFTPHRVYKIKRPVHYGFIDLRDVADRRRICEAEVDLNRRLSPDVYEGVGQWVAPDGTAEPVVVMRRLPDDRRLSALATADADGVGGHVDRIAEVLVDFHRRAARGDEIDRDGRVDAIAQLWCDNLQEVRALEPAVVDGAVLDDIADRAARYLEGQAGVFGERIAGGHIVDGHGDLLADDIFCLDDGPRIIDCLEFDDRLRHGDVLLDVAMLAMDLERVGRSDLGDRLLRSYRESSGDAWPDSLAHFYVAYRATVRGKVAAIRAASGDRDAAVTARHLYELCARHLRAGAVRLVLVGGLPGTGKSTLAGEMARATGWRLLRTDTVRQDVTDRDGTSPDGGEFATGRYAPEVTAAVYAELCRRAGELLAAGHSVILDGTWSSRAEREGARAVAETTGATLVALRCVAPPEVAAARIARRLREGTDPSEATPAVARAMAGVADAWPEATAVDTAGDLRRATEAALGATGCPPGVARLG